MQDDSASAYVRVLFHQNRSGTYVKKFGWNRPAHQMLTRSIIVKCSARGSACSWGRRDWAALAPGRRIVRLARGRRRG